MFTTLDSKRLSFMYNDEVLRLYVVKSQDGWRVMKRSSGSSTPIPFPTRSIHSSSEKELPPVPKKLPRQIQDVRASLNFTKNHTLSTTCNTKNSTTYNEPPRRRLSKLRRRHEIKQPYLNINITDSVTVLADSSNDDLENNNETKPFSDSLQSIIDMDKHEQEQSNSIRVETNRLSRDITQLEKPRSDSAVLLHEFESNNSSSKRHSRVISIEYKRPIHTSGSTATDYSFKSVDSSRGKSQRLSWFMSRPESQCHIVAPVPISPIESVDVQGLEFFPSTSLDQSHARESTALSLSSIPPILSPSSRFSRRLSGQVLISPVSPQFKDRPSTPRLPSIDLDNAPLDPFLESKSPSVSQLQSPIRVKPQTQKLTGTIRCVTEDLTDISDVFFASSSSPSVATTSPSTTITSTPTSTISSTFSSFSFPSISTSSSSTSLTDLQSMSLSEYLLSEPCLHLFPLPPQGIKPLNPSNVPCREGEKEIERLKLPVLNTDDLIQFDNEADNDDVVSSPSCARKHVVQQRQTIPISRSRKLGKSVVGEKSDNNEEQEDLLIEL